MADVNLIEWTANQPNWARDALRRIATTAEFIVGEEDRAAILERLKHAASGTGTAPNCEPITPEHLSQCADAGPRAVLASIGPLQNIDRLAKDQQLRFAPRGITLIFGENGSGKSGYARIAKRLCRSLSIDELKGDVFKAKPDGPMQVRLRFQLGDAALTELDWAPDTKPPGALKQISVFDSRNARLYVDQQNRIAYLPVEIAVLEHHGQLCGAFGAEFTTQQTAIEKRLKTPLPAGYTPGGTMQKLLAQLEAKSQTLPKKAELEKLAGLSEAELEELKELEHKLAQDPVAQATTRRRAVQVLTRLNEALKALEEGLSDEVAKQLASLAQNTKTTAAAAGLAANQQFAAEPLKLVGGDAWRLLYEAARDFAVLSGGPVDRIADQVGTPCPLCQERLVDEAAKRMARFNAFVQSEAAKRADAARDALGKARETLETLTVPTTDVVTGTLTAYAALDAQRASLLIRIEATLTAYTARRSSLLASIAKADQELAPLPSSLRPTLSADVEKLGAEAIQLEASATHAAALDADRARIASLKDRAKLQHDLPTVLQRLAELQELAATKACQAQVQTRAISLQISALRRKLVTESLQNRIQAEITKLDLDHIPFRVSDTSEQGQSRFSVSLQGIDKIANNQILSEGEQRALALACFLAEIADEGEGYGLVVDDPVSSLDQRRIRLVAERLVHEAAKGRQVIVFTHSLVFFNEVVAQAAKAGEAAPLIKMVIRKTEAQGFGVVEEDTEPWLARSVSARITDLRARAKQLSGATDFTSDIYRRQAKDFYSDLRETWERSVEEVVLNKTVERLVPDVMTKRLSGVVVSDEDYKAIFFAMKHVSERSGHDMPAGRDIPVPNPTEMLADVQTLDAFQANYKNRRNATAKIRNALEEPAKAALV
ncbi:MAG: AAA family ATPase [Beijerinckiaceae bacterium]|nr:AAA family ATPase [Beijerinckiaceae bacterium]